MNTQRSLLLLSCLLLSACATTRPDAAAKPEGRRLFAPTFDGAPVIAGISYGPFREGQSPAGPFPSTDEILEDLRIIGERWHMIRIYGSRGPAEAILATIREHQLPIRVQLGIWLDASPDQDTDAEVDEGIRLANAYPDVVFAVNVGNESQVFWSAHRVPRKLLLDNLRKVRAAVKQPVTTADDYNFWNKPESHAVAAEVDFILLHAYAMWNGIALEEAVPWTAGIVDSIRAEHPGLPIVIGETGWATELNPDGSEVEHIKAPAGEAEQAAFYADFTAWAERERIPYFYFEAFDEPWKGSDDPREVEKHWGLFRVDRTPKPALAE